MSPDKSACDALFAEPLPTGFVRRIFEVEPGLDLDLGTLPDAIFVVARGEVELECHAGTCRRFGRGSMIPVARLPVSRVRSFGPGALVLVAISRDR